MTKRSQKAHGDGRTVKIRVPLIALRSALREALECAPELKQPGSVDLVIVISADPAAGWVPATAAIALRAPLSARAWGRIAAAVTETR